METLKSESLAMSEAKSTLIGEEINPGKGIGLLYNIVVFWEM